MENQDKYKKVVAFLSRNKPVLDDREKLSENILKKIADSNGKGLNKKSINYLAFSWVNIGWFRSAMAAAASILIGLFIFQQIMINQRIKNLEDQLVKTVNTINAGWESGVKQKLLLQAIFDENSPGDSITVSRADLNNLLDAYMEAENINKNILGNPVYRSYIQKLLGNSFEQNAEDGDQLKNL